ncbi:MAG: hypothetical protein HWD61_04040 [Parachlamydiaceae bacterium]|nr:MAG: hypothetical protein HWD61_04040 [Parachlamydiaceae bacterium]
MSDEDTPEEKIQLFLKFVTGTSSLANHGIISVGAYNLCETPTALMKSHTCSSAVDIWNETFTTMVEEDGIEKEYSDDNEEGFIKILSRGIANKENMKYFGQT